MDKNWTFRGLILLTLTCLIFLGYVNWSREEQKVPVSSNNRVDILSEEYLRRLKEKLSALDKEQLQDRKLLPVEAFSGDFEEMMLWRLKSALPPDWSITRTERGSAPDDWHTFDKTGFMVECRKGDKTFHVWVLQRNWIGIRKPDRIRLRLTSREDILRGEGFVMITNCTDTELQEALHKVNPTSERWHDAEEAFKGQFEEADRKVWQLIHQYCKDQVSRNEAAYSLIRLGIPAKNIFLKCALDGQGEARELCLSELGCFGGKDSVAVLCKVLSDPQTSPECQKSAAWSLERIADPDAGPALLKALNHITWSGVSIQAAAALERIRYRQAAQKILELMQKEKSTYCKERYAKALATLRYNKAIPAIKKLCNVKNFTAEWALDSGKNDDYTTGWMEIALLRLIEPWGEPADGVRLLFLPPEKAQIGRPVKLALIVENVSDKTLDIIGYLEGDFTINSEKHEGLGIGLWQGICSLGVNSIWIRAYDLSGMISQPGTYHVCYEVGNAKSNTVTFDVSAPTGK